METLNDSKYQMMRGMIALAWADGVLEQTELVMVEKYIDSNRHLSPQQRVELKESIATPLSIMEVWDKITDLYDRARLIDVAGVIFHADGDYSIKEREVYAQMLTLHLQSLKGDVSASALTMLTEKAKVEAKQQEAQYKAETKTPSKMGLLIWRFNKAMGFAS